MTEDERYESLRHCKYNFSQVLVICFRKIYCVEILCFGLMLDICSVSILGFSF